ncbi:MAG: hypothetical protein QGG56_08685, partial [Dehalococcoidia bacterium]|nr:hypothetical protein [Dehalococcoidia bacterium]
AATQELRQQVERRRADIEAEEQRQGLELQQQQEKHRLELEKLREMDRLSIQGLIAISGDSKAPLLAELARTESMKGLSVEQILAMAAEKKPEVAQSLSELASGAGSEEQKQLYERLLSEQKDSQKQTREDHREFIQIQKQMFQDTMDTLSQIAQANARGQGPPLAAPGVGATQPGSPPPGTPERVVVCRCCLAESPVGTKYCPNCGDSLTGRE